MNRTLKCFAFCPVLWVATWGAVARATPVYANTVSYCSTVIFDKASGSYVSSNVCDSFYVSTMVTINWDWTAPFRLEADSVSFLFQDTLLPFMKSGSIRSYTELRLYAEGTGTGYIRFWLLGNGGVANITIGGRTFTSGTPSDNPDQCSDNQIKGCSLSVLDYPLQLGVPFDIDLSSAAVLGSFNDGFSHILISTKNADGTPAPLHLIPVTVPEPRTFAALIIGFGVIAFRYGIRPKC